MCGIVGYIGKNIKIKKIVEKLKLLEYRGYDSAGVFALNNQKELTLKSVGNISKLEEILPNNFDAKMAIAHTRWATHGKPSQENCHPHASKNKEWTIVHNGIIENYLNLKQNLKEEIESQTDTAVLSQYLEEKQVTDINSFIDAFSAVEGSYAIAAINKNSEVLYLAKYKSPLYIAKIETGYICASDPSCFAGDCDEFYALEDGEFAAVSQNEIVFFNKDKKILQKYTKNTKNCVQNTEKISHKHFMLKEIEEQSEAIKRLVETYSHNGLLEKFDEKLIKNIDKIVILGCGTAYHASLMGVRFFEEIANFKASAEIASEFIYKRPLFINEKTLVIAVSQSGETADTLKALEIAKSYGAITVALTNVEYSTIVSKAKIVLPVCAGVEKAVASTKAYVCQLCLLYLLANHFYSIITKNISPALNELDKISNTILSFDKTMIDKIASEIKTRNDCIFIGKDVDCVSAMEASLKLKEVTYINSSSYPSGELKHGFLALVEENTPLFVFALNGETNQKTLNAAAEAEARGAIKIIITKEELQNKKSAKIIKIKEKNKFLAQMLAIVPMQYLAYKVSVLKNINPDQPRNLAKSVTVE